MSSITYLGPGVGRPPHLDDLQHPQDIPPSRGVPEEDDPIHDRLLDAVRGEPTFGGGHLRDEERRAAEAVQALAEGEHEVADPLLAANAVPDRGERIEHDPLSAGLGDQAQDRTGQ